MRDLIVGYPNDVEGWYNLGEAYFHQGSQGLYPPEAFRAAFHRAVELDPTYSLAYLHLIEDAFARGDSVGARELIVRHRQDDPGSPYALGHSLAYTLAWGDSASRAEARAALDTAATEVLNRAWWTLMYGSSDFEEPFLRVSRALVAERHPMHTRSSIRRNLALVYSTRGRIRDARETLSATAAEEGFALDASEHLLIWHLAGYPDAAATRHAAEVLASTPEPWDRFLVGALAANDRRWADAENELVSLESGAAAREVQKDSLAAADQRAFAQALRGYVAIRRGDGQGAIRELEGALPVLPGGTVVRSHIHHFLRYELAKVHFDSGDLLDAERYFKSLLTPSSPPPSLFVRTTPAELHLGRIYEALGKTDESRFHYARFVRGWQDCDPELRPMWEEGRRALERLGETPQR